MAEVVDYDEDIQDTSAAHEDVSHAVQDDGAGFTTSHHRRSGKPKIKGRGHGSAHMDDSTGKYDGRGGIYERLGRDRGASGPIESVEGWILLVTGVHEEAAEEDILDKFSEFGDVKNISVNLDRRTGFVKGYALVEFGDFSHAEAAITGMNGQDILGKTVEVGWAFEN